MFAAHGDVALVAADFDLFAFFDRFTIWALTEVHGGFTGTIAKSESSYQGENKLMEMLQAQPGGGLVHFKAKQANDSYG
ncbi:MAG: hypothetical protein ACI9NC_005316 [Verrucomicrobiales bacterium]|jgi:hypothetical protein